MQTQERTIELGHEQIDQSARHAWSIVPGSEKLGWTARKKYFMLVPVTAHGSFSSVAGQITMRDNDPRLAHATISVAVASQDSAQAKRDAHLQGPDFFDAEKYPQITFESTSIEPVASKADAYRVSGRLTARGQTRPIMLDATFIPEAGNTRAHVTLHGSINRQDFGMTWSAAPFIKLFDEIDLAVEVDIARA